MNSLFVKARKEDNSSQEMGSLRLEVASLLLLLSLLYQKLDLCVSLNDEGRTLLSFKDRVELDPFGALANWVGGDLNPCSWFGVGCSDDGRVVALSLKDLCLKGTIAPELGKLIHMKSLILHNNSFYGVIPREIGNLPILKVLDLGHNKFTEPVPSNLGSTLSLEVLILGSYKFTGEMSPELHKFDMLSECRLDEDLLSSKKGAATRNVGNAAIRKLLQISEEKRKHHEHRKDNMTTHVTPPAPSPSPSSTPPPLPSMPRGGPPPLGASLQSGSPSPAPNIPAPVAAPLTNELPPTVSPQALSVISGPTGKHTASWRVYISVAFGGSFLLGLSAIFFLCCRANKVVTVRPWSTGLSGQLRKAFVTGIPALKRSELEVACEDFSNIVGSVSNYMLYKGTLSSGVEIAVTSSVVTSAKEWSKESEVQFRKKISVLSKINHKNFANLLGFCEEDEPFTRMMVFEYAPNGTLFEHLHIREAEHLDWATRLRIAMGVAYCLEHMHQLNPPVILRHIDSSSIYLTDDFAAKISDFGFWTEEKEAQSTSDGSSLLDSQVLGPEGIVHRFGIILLEILSGRRPFSEDNGLLVLWASSYLNGKRLLKDMIDQTLESFCEEQVGLLCDLIRSCINSDPKERPTMSEVVSQLREITSMPPDGAAPKLSPLWWAELEIISADAT